MQELNIGDKITFLPHRLMALSDKMIAVISEESNGWCVTNVDEYLYIKEFFAPQKTVVLDNKTKKIDFVTSLWKSDLISKNGCCLSKIVESDAPRLLSLKMTGNCNFNCSYCYDYHEDRVKKVIPIDKVKKLFHSFCQKNKAYVYCFMEESLSYNFL
jgi:sulfatase maturation enzyme AslB (radical SAM superfamily)